MNKKTYLDILEKRCGQVASYFNEIKADNGPPISIIGFDDYPRSGNYTYFSYGLHKVGRPEWKYGRPEYYICINIGNREFAMFFAYLISAFAWEKVMGWNTLIGAGESDAVAGYPYRRIALGPPMYLEWSDYKIVGDELPIHLGMGYYISDVDFTVAAEMGFCFLDMKTKEIYDYWRRIQSAQQVDSAEASTIAVPPFDPSGSPR